MSAYYNEIDPYAAQWLRNLIAAGHIAPGDVDERSIVDVRPDDVRPYDQCHWFAGIGGWSYALRLAGWDDERPVWTGSCPCQPFSAAGQGKAADDERHLWPAWFPLVAECRPAIIFGEQVEAAIGWGWLDAVFADLESEGYACGAAVLPACGVGAPHIRQRVWFVADAHSRDTSTEWLQRGGQQRLKPQDGGSVSLADAGHQQAWRSAEPSEVQGGRSFGDAAGCGNADELADAYSSGRSEQRGGGLLDGKRTAFGNNADGCIANGELGDASASGLPPCERSELSGPQQFDQGRATEQPSRSPWADIEWLPCTDGKARPTKPGLQPLAHGLRARVGKLRAAGNAIVPQVAAEFIKACE